MRLNSKQFKTNIGNYVLSRLNAEAYEKHFKTDKETLSFVYECFKSEFWYDYNQQRYKSEVIGFSEWLKGLPSVINTAFENYRIIELSKELGSYKDASKMTAKQIEDYEYKIIDHWFVLIAETFFRLL